MSDTRIIETAGLTKHFGDFAAVSDLSLRVSSQQITGFLGRNGAGKSTTIKMLLGMTRPSAGSGTVLGSNIRDPRANREMRRDVAYVGEDKQLYAYMTVEEIVRFTKSFYRDWRGDVARDLLARYQLPPSRKVKALSKGMRTKLALLLALARRPKLLILDEPSEGLDPVSIEELLKALVAAAAEGTTVFFSSHQIAEVERISDHVCIIDRGALAAEVSLDAIRSGYRRVTLGFSTDVPAREFALPGVRHVESSGRQLTFLASIDIDAIVQRARSLGAVSVDVTPTSLREVFLDTVQVSA